MGVTVFVFKIITRNIYELRLQRLILEVCSAEHPCTKLTHARRNPSYTLAAFSVKWMSLGGVRVIFFLNKTLASQFLVDVLVVSN
jgi:hypothetical protein